MPSTPRTAVQSAARALLQSLAALPIPPTLRIAEVEGRVACLILVWDAASAMPTAASQRRDRSGTRRAGCRQDILAAIREAGRPLTRKELVRMLKDARKGHGPGTIAKALADLTASGELLNPKDKRGYRLPEWRRRRETPSLF